MSNIIQSVKDKIASKYRSWKYVEGEYFEVVPDSDDPSVMMTIKLLKGPFSGIIYAYGAINIGEDLGHRGVMASFGIDIVSPKELEQHYLNDVAFSKLTGQILLVVLERAVESQFTKTYKENISDEEDRESYFEEPVPRRTLREESPAVSEDRIPEGKTRKDPVRRNSKVRPKIQSNPYTGGDPD